jgi:hypothetical protein
MPPLYFAASGPAGRQPRSVRVCLGELARLRKRGGGLNEPRWGYSVVPLIGGGKNHGRQLKSICRKSRRRSFGRGAWRRLVTHGGQIRVWTLAHGHWLDRAHTRGWREGWHRLPRARHCLAALVGNDLGSDSRP